MWILAVVLSISTLILVFALLIYWVVTTAPDPDDDHPL